MASCSNRFAVLQEHKPHDTIDPFKKLPIDVWYLVLEFLDIKSMGNLWASNHLFLKMVERYLKYNCMATQRDFPSISTNVVAQNSSKWIQMLKIEKPKINFPFHVKKVDKVVHYKVCEEIMKSSEETVCNLINHYRIESVSIKILFDIVEKNSLSDDYKELLESFIRDNIGYIYQSYNCKNIHLHVLVVAYITGSIGLIEPLMDKTCAYPNQDSVKIDNIRWADAVDIPTIKSWLGDDFFITAPN